ncbi:LCP family protein [Frigoribacterium sp. PhB160]|uniref:LCP family protein n=1 Tax=Frigoribacterium sp. PhB160 TaxID=2485192 RepID=UPI000F485176|nr:LCP family protein [Frigoribacterium sp. PhB160]
MRGWPGRRPDEEAPPASADAPGPAARHGRLPRHPAWLTALEGGAVVVGVVLVSSVSIAAWATWDVARQIQGNSVDLTANDGGDATPLPAVDELEGGFNVLFVGADNEEGQDQAAFGQRDATLNDFNLLLHVSADHTNATAVSIPRDLIVAHPECTDPVTGETSAARSAAPMNTAMARGGLACVADTVESLTGLDVPYAAVLTFAGVRGISDAIGGVDVCLADPVRDPDSGLDLEAGVQTLSGDDALKFLRTRYGVGDGSDLARISGQQAYLSSLLRKVKSDGTLTSIPTLYSLANVAAKTITLSSSLTDVDQMIAMARVFRDMDLAAVTFVQYPGTTEDPSYPGKVVPITSQADVLMAKLAADEPVVLAGDSTGLGTTLDPAATAPPATPGDPAAPDASADPSADPTLPGTPAESGAPAPSDPAAEPLEGLSGQSAAQQTCSVGYGRG